MEIPKKYFHDRVVLFLISFNTFFVLLTSLLSLLHIDSNSSDLFLAQCRYCSEDFPQRIYGSSVTLFSMIAFSFIILISHIVLSMRIYDEKRRYAVTILAMASLLIIFTLVISNSLSIQN
jgi:hypothetical protein